MQSMKAAPMISRRRLAPRRKSARPTRQRTLYDLLKKFDGRLTDLPKDFAAKLDHSLYGSPKTAKQ